MDNNFNGQQVTPQQAPQPVQQPVYAQQAPQQPVYAQPVQQPVYAQAPSPVYQPQQAPKQPMNLNILELIAVICGGVGTLLAILGTTFMCSCSANSTFDYNRDDYGKNSFVAHPIMVLAIIGGLLGIAAVVLAIIALKQKDAKVKAGKLAWVAAIVGLFATVYAFIPTLTICGYNCALESAQESALERYYDDLRNDYDDYDDEESLWD